MPSSLSSASMADDGCPDFEFDTHGRQGVGVAQPQSGIDYPLVTPSEDVRYLFADLQLQFDDPGLYGGTPFTPPFRLHWLYGVGCTGDADLCPSSSESLVAPSLSSERLQTDIVDAACCPTHAQDITIVDRDNRVVFHSPDAAQFMSRAWGSRLHIYEWRDSRLGYCLLAVHTKWQHDEGEYSPQNYPINLFPALAIIDERAIFRLPKRVRSLTVVLDNLSRTAVDFRAGFNMEIIEQPPADITTQSLRNRHQILFNATPGAGLGVFPGCVADPLVIRRINGINPTDLGDFYLAATDCYWVRQPTRVVSTSPRLTTPEISLPPGNVPTPGLPAPQAGTAKNLLGWPTNDDPRYAHLQIGNDCEPCCDCDDYVAVAAYLNRIRDQYQTLGQDFESIRDQYHENITRWADARECFNRRPLRLFFRPQVCPYLDVAIQFCNQTDECQTGVELVVLFAATGGGIGEEVPGFTFITGARSKEGRRSGATDRYQLGGSWPEYSAYFDAVNPGQSVSARFRLGFDNCGAVEDFPYVITGILTGTTTNGPIIVVSDGNDSDSSGLLVEAVAEQTETLNCPPGPGTTFPALKCVNC